MLKNLLSPFDFKWEHHHSCAIVADVLMRLISHCALMNTGSLALQCSSHGDNMEVFADSQFNSADTSIAPDLLFHA